DAEVQFLFTAPVSRRSLLMHRLMRSQIGVLFAAIVPALVFPTGSTMGRVRFAAAMWVLLVTIRVHFTGITLARASLALGGVDARRRQWGPLAAMLAAVAYVVATLVKAFRGMQPADLRDALDRFSGAVSGGAARVILWPFMALARPLFADA